MKFGGTISEGGISVQFTNCIYKGVKLIFITQALDNLIMLQSISADSDQTEALQIAGVTAGIRKEIFKYEGFKLSGHFPSNSECDSIPYNLKLLISMIVYGPTPKSKERVSMTQQYPIFQFSDTVMRMKLLILKFVRAHLEKKFELYVETLEEPASFPLH